MNIHLQKSKLNPKSKTLQVFLLVDNRNEKINPSNCQNGLDFRGSAFKQTQIDPLQSRYDLLNQNISRGDLFNMSEQDYLIFNLNKRIIQLQIKVNKLERENSSELLRLKQQEDLKKKKRRRFQQLKRDHKCSFQQCSKIYGSETSLKNHLKIKHKQNL